MMTKRLVGVYYNPEEAVQVVDNLKKQGFKKKEILLIANEDVRSRIPFGNDIKVDDDREVDERSFWEKVKDAFSFDETSYEDYTGEHKEAIREGAILVYVEANRDYDSTLLVNEDIYDTKYDRPSVENIDPNLNENYYLKGSGEKQPTAQQKSDQKEIIESKDDPVSETLKVPVDDEVIVIERRRVRGGEIVDDVIIEDVEPDEE